jgi:hypothetical protein
MQMMDKMSQLKAPKRYGQRRTVTLRLSQPLYEAMKKATETSGRSLTAEIEVAVAEFVAHQQHDAHQKEIEQSFRDATAAFQAATAAHSERIGELQKTIERLTFENISLQGKLAADIIGRWDRGEKT